MQNINFTSRIRPVNSQKFSQFITAINRENFVDYPWTVASSRIAKDVFTNNICDCTGVLITTGEKALLMHLNPAVEENHNFKNVFKYISNNVDLENNELQAVIVGSNPNDAESADIFNRFIKFFKDYKIPTTLLKSGNAPVNIAYRSCTDEIIVSNKKMDSAINSGKNDLESLRSGFKQVEISNCDYVV